MKKSIACFLFLFVLSVSAVMAAERWLQQDQPLEICSHTIMVVNVDENGDICGIEVDGGMARWVDVGSADVFGDISIRVIDAVPVHSKDGGQDTCELDIVCPQQQDVPEFTAAGTLIAIIGAGCFLFLKRR